MLNRKFEKFKQHPIELVKFYKECKKLGVTEHPDIEKLRTIFPQFGLTEKDVSEYFYKAKQTYEELNGK